MSVINMIKLIRRLVSVYQLVLFFSDVYQFLDLPVHFVAFSVNDLGLIPVSMTHHVTTWCVIVPC